MGEPSESDKRVTDVGDISEGFSVSITRTKGHGESAGTGITTSHGESVSVTTSHGTSVSITRGRSMSTGTTRKEPSDATDKGKA